METVVFLVEDQDTADILHYIFLVVPSYGSVLTYLLTDAHTHTHTHTHIHTHAHTQIPAHTH